MSTSIVESQSQYHITSGGVTVAHIPLTGRRNTPIRLFVYGASDPVEAGSTGMSTYFITMRRSKLSTDEAVVTSLQPSGIVALDKTGTTYRTFVSGYETKPIGTIKVESSPYFESVAVATPLLGTSNPGSGMVYPSGDFSYAPGYVYMFEYYEWEKDTYYWFYVGATDKAGNATKFSDMVAHGQNPWSGMIPSTEVPIPQEDTTPPSGMLFLYV